MALLTLKFVTDVRDPDYEVVEFHGELDQSNLAATEKQMRGALKTFDRPHLVCDLSDLHFVHSEGIGFFASMHAKLAKRGQHLALCGLKGNIADVFSAVGMDKLIPMFPSVSDAVHSIKKT